MSKIPMDDNKLARIEARYYKNWPTTETPVPASFLVAACEDVPDLIGEVRRLREMYEAGRSAFNEASKKQEARINELQKASEESYEEARLVFEDQHALIERLRTDNHNLKAEVDKLKAEENSRLEYVSHAVGQVLKAEEERDEALAVIGSPGYSPNCMACSDLRNRGAAGSAGAMKARALQDARSRVVGKARQVRAAEKHLAATASPEKFNADEATNACHARDQACTEFEEAVDALETLEAPISGGDDGSRPLTKREILKARNLGHRAAWAAFDASEKESQDKFPMIYTSLEKARLKLNEKILAKRIAAEHLMVMSSYGKREEANRSFIIACEELEAAKDALDRLETPAKPAPVDALMGITQKYYQDPPKQAPVRHQRTPLEEAEAQILKQANLMATLMKEVLRLGSELSAAEKKAKEGKEAP